MTGLLAAGRRIRDLWLSAWPLWAVFIFALLAGSLASFVGLTLAMYLTRNLDWYGGKAAAPQTTPTPATPAGA